jgi:hypothetical protein
LIGFVCWRKDNEDDPGAEPPRRNRVLDVLSVEGAAEQYAERVHADCDYFEEAIIMVRDPEGQVHTVTVTVEYSPTFYAEVQP